MSTAIPKNMQAIWAVRMPTALKKRCIRAAKKAKLTPGEWARQVLVAATKK